MDNLTQLPPATGPRAPTAQVDRPASPARGDPPLAIPHAQQREAGRARLALGAPSPGAMVLALTRFNAAMTAYSQAVYSCRNIEKVLRRNAGGPTFADQMQQNHRAATVQVRVALGQTVCALHDLVNTETDAGLRTEHRDLLNQLTGYEHDSDQ